MSQYAHTAMSRSVGPATAQVHVRYIVLPALVWLVALAAIVATSVWPGQLASQPDPALQSLQDPVAEPLGSLAYGA